MKNKLLLVAGLLLATLPACNKDEDDDPQTVFEKDDIVLNADNEVGTVTSSGTGSADVSYDKSNKVLTYNITWTGLTGPVIAAHIHGPAPKEENANVKKGFTGFPNTAAGTYNGLVMIDTVGIKEDSLLTGFYYINLHTTANPGGEIRGQIEF